MINARAGTPLGGPRVIAEADLADEQARALSDIDLSGLAQALALAREIHAQDTRRADALENQAYQRWLDSARMSMDAYKTDLGQRNIDRSFGLQELIANRDYELGLGSLDLSRLAEERARKSQEFDFERYFKSPEAQDWYLPLIKQQIEAGIAATNRSNRPQPSQPREVKPETSINHRATQSAVAGVWDYDTPEEALEAYGYYAGDMAANGVDLSKVWGEMIRRWPNYSAFNNNTFIGGGLATD